MSKEVRCIMFTSDEIQVALTHFVRCRVPSCNPYELAKVDLSERDGAVTARITLSIDGASSGMTLDAHELMAAILMYCRACRIPLSNRSTKKIELSEVRLVLVMSMN